MGIERSLAPSVQKTAEPQPNTARNKSDANGASKEAGGFAAVMQAQETPPPEPKRPVAEKEKPAEPASADAVDHEAEVKDATEDDDQAVAEKAAKDAAAKLELAMAQLLGVVAPAQPPAADAPADAVARSAWVATDAVAGVGAATGKPAPTQALLAQLAAQAAGRGKSSGGAAEIGAPAVDATQGEAALADAAKRVLAATVDRTGLADGRAAASTLANYASVLEQLQSRLAKAGVGGAGEVPADGTALPTNAIDNSVGGGKSAAGLAQHNARMDRLLAGMQEGGSFRSATSEAATVASLSSEMGDALKSLDRFHGEAPRGANGGGAEGAFGQHGFTPTVQFDGTAVSATLPGQPTGEAVADQVSTWIGQGVQNAELTLDGLNSERVDVKISMSGKEAHVEFRSDQPATREMLAGSLAHLKDLLSSQGVVLTGVTVSHSGAELASGQQQQSRAREGRDSRDGQSRGMAGESRAVAAVAPSVASAARAPAGTLDLFV
ncbi:MAG: hypothetical protein JWP29_2477 [Rhodoferax sp.]|nr:hypothetical protein [Rhodoferax sp.]